MITNIRAWGNSQGIYIPKKLLQEAAISVNDSVELIVVDGAIVIRKNMSDDIKRKALSSLREIRNAHKDKVSSISSDYRAERNEHIDEKYGR